MKNRRLLALLLAFCMVFSNLTMGVSAIEAPADSVMNTEAKANEAAATETDVSPFANKNLVSGEDIEKNDAKTLKDDGVLVKSEITESKGTATGGWDVTPVADPDVSLLPEEVPETIQELKKAAEVFAADETVRAFVVMEAAPLASSNASKSLASAAAEKQLIEKQNTVISAIERSVLGGKELTVRYQFTYLTNSFSIETEFVNLEKIAKLEGVKSVFVMPVYNAIPSDETANPNTAGASVMTGVNKVWDNLGFTGKGMKIAVIDTGLDLDHPSFAAEPETTENSLTIADIDAVLENLNAYAKRGTITGKTLYRSAKVPYAFNYVDNSLTADHSADGQGDHGTHVAGIAAANAVSGTEVKGMAPDAQIIVMKVFGAAGGAYTDDIVAALEDAMTLGCDVVNASLGSPAGFTTTNTEIDLIYARLAEQDIVACISAGNEGTSSYGNMWGTDMNRTSNPDNATVGQPGVFENVMTVASADNAMVMANYMALTDGTKVFYQDSIEGQYKAAGYPGYEYAACMTDLAGQEFEYVIVPGLGSEEDVASVDVAGKIAVIKRGELNFSTKVMNAQNAGAAAVIIWNTNDTDDLFNFGMTTEIEEGVYPAIPSCIIYMRDGQTMADAETKIVNIAKELGAREDSNGGQMSSFSSWGVAPDLSLEPDITGVGGNVYSCYDGGQYGLMSGTSMSSPQVAGVTALVMQRLYELYPDAAPATVRNLAEALLMSTADPITATYTKASPRQQGAGLVDAFQATTSETYLTVKGEKPKAELGDSSTGKFNFSFEVHNFGKEEITYVNKGIVTTELAASGYGEYWMYGENMPLDGRVTFDQNAVTVPAGGTVTVNATVTLTEDDKAYFQSAWPNGGYVEGFVFLYAIDEEGMVTSKLNLPYLGFYGDWTKAPVFDTAYWYDNSFWGLAPANDVPEGDEYYNVMWTDLGGSDYVLGFNPYSGPVTDANGNVAYDPAHNVVSPNGDGVLDGISEMYLSLLRNARTLTLTWTVDGKVMDQETFEYNGKTMYRSNYGQVVPWLYSWYGYGLYDFTDENGNALPSGTEVLLTVDATVDYGTGGNHTIQIPVTVDTQPGKVEAAVTTQLDDGTDVLGVMVSDDVAVASVILMNPNGTQIYAQVYDYDLYNGIVYFDISELGTEFTVAVCDYAANEGYYKVTYEDAPDSNLPAMDNTKLYGYRVYDYHIMSDHMFGWVAVDKPAEGASAQIGVLTDDYLEYAAINAAEYVDGKIFAVDAVYNLVVMEPGLFNRNQICNLGVNVLDMTFDDSTDTMYVLSKQDSYTYLYSMDLTTGELTELKSFGYYTQKAPYAIADDDNGTIYAIKYGSANIYTLDTANDYALTEVKTLVDGVEANVVIKDSDGEDAKPNYAQGLTYADGKLYWAYYRNMYDWYLFSDLITIDTETWESYACDYLGTAYTAEGQLVEYAPYTELVGLLTLTDTEYTIPAATELKGILVDETGLLMTVGDSADITATAQPWNYEMTDVTWTSSDEAVATVADGHVTAVGEGKAIITVSSEGKEATVEVTVVKISGHFNAYAYMSGDGNSGYMVDVNMGTMDYVLTEAPGADFVAGDYNGHDGKFYGYTEGGQFWSFDPETDELTKIGDPVGTFPYDMAYDYATGLMYAITMDQSMGVSYINLVNMKTGAMEAFIPMEGNYLMTLACDTEGNLYVIDGGYGVLVKITMVDGVPEDMQPVMQDLGMLQYLQSMCWDHNNDVLIWAYPEYASIVWMDPNAEEPYGIMLGDPTGGAGFEYTGMFTIPAEIPELPTVAVQGMEAYDMMMLSGVTKAPNITVYPFNATNQSVALTSSDESIVKVNADGTLTAGAEGEATISGSLVDGENTFAVEFTVSVMEGADEVYGMVLADLATMGGQYWARMYPHATNDPDMLKIFNYVIYSEEYYNGNLYAVGYDPDSWDANWQFFILDAETYAIKSQVDVGEGYPFVYDMTYDYNTGIMYALAGAGENATDLYMMDMETGALVLLQQTEEYFMSIAAGPDGKLYAMENSKSSESADFWDPWATPEYSNAMLYTIDPVTNEIELVGDTGVKCNMMASMSYDYDTDRLYWTGFYNGATYVTGLYVVNTETGAATNLGTIGAAGAQVSGLYIISDSFPAESAAELQKLFVSPTKTTVLAGQTATVSAYILPASLNVDVQWTSSDETVATVDANGVVTGVAGGKTNITASVTYGDKTLTASCAFSVLDADAAFLTWNKTDNAWATISRADASVTNLTEGCEDAEVVAIASKGTAVYGYDVEGNFFSLSNETYERTTIGTADFDDAVMGYLDFMGEDEEVLPYFAFEIRDLAYDAANDRFLALGGVVDSEYGDEVNGGNAIYEVDVTTGALTEVYRVLDTYNIHAMTVGDDGTVYYYSTYMDYYTALDLETGVQTDIVTGQTQSLYGDGYSSHALYYDAVTGLINHLFTQNGSYYRLLTVDPETATLKLAFEGIGEVVRDEWGANTGDLFAGLTYVDYAFGHVCVHDWEDATCTEPKTCKLCGVTDGEALGHDWMDATYDAPKTCKRCGATEGEPLTRLPVTELSRLTNTISGIRVVWNKAENVQKYGLWRSETGLDGTYKWIGNPTTDNFLDKNVESGKTYFYKVTTMDVETGNHSEKSEAMGITFVGTPKINLRVNRAAGIGLGWNKVEGATGYAVYRKSFSGTDSWVRVATIEGGDTLAWNDTTVKNANGTAYRYNVRALTGEDMKTMSGCLDNGYTMVRLTSRALNSVTAASKTSVKVSWGTTVQATGYEVRFMVDGKVYKTFTVDNYKTGVKTFTDLTTGQTYKVQVRSYKTVDGVGTFYSAWSTAKNVTLG